MIWVTQSYSFPRRLFQKCELSLSVSGKTNFRRPMFKPANLSHTANDLCTFLIFSLWNSYLFKDLGTSYSEEQSLLICWNCKKKKKNRRTPANLVDSDLLEHVPPPSTPLSPTFFLLQDWFGEVFHFSVSPLVLLRTSEPKSLAICSFKWYSHIWVCTKGPSNTAVMYTALYVFICSSCFFEAKTVKTPFLATV